MVRACRMWQDNFQLTGCNCNVLTASRQHFSVQLLKQALELQPHRNQLKHPSNNDAIARQLTVEGHKHPSKIPPLY